MKIKQREKVENMQVKRTVKKNSFCMRQYLAKKKYFEEKEKRERDENIARYVKFVVSKRN